MGIQRSGGENFSVQGSLILVFVVMDTAVAVRAAVHVLVIVEVVQLQAAAEAAAEEAE